MIVGSTTSGTRSNLIAVPIPTAGVISAAAFAVEHLHPDGSRHARFLRAPGDGLGQCERDAALSRDGEWVRRAE
jgi:hypothetical protein